MWLADRLRAFPIFAQQFDNHVPMPLHRHDGAWELVLITRGMGRHLLEDHAFSVSPGDVFVIPADVPHGYGDCESLGLVNVIFDPARLHLPENQLLQAPGYAALFHLEPKLRARHQFQSRLRIEQETLKEILESIRRMRDEMARKLPGFEAAATAHFCHVIVALARNYGNMTEPLPNGVVRLSEVAQWLEHNFDKAISVNTLAEVARMSRSTFLRSFRECFHVSPMTYVTKLRIDKAARLLRDPTARVKEIAPRVGIEDSSYFARVFRRHMGVDPRAYRNQHLRSNPIVLNIHSD